MTHTPHANALDASWDAAFDAALADAIEHLAALVFDEGWQELLAASGGNSEAALRESVRLYERGLADLFAIARAAGAPESAVAWSTLKARLRREALESELEITLRTALDVGLYAAEATPLGDHALYRAWSGALTRFLSRLAAQASPPPAPPANEEARLSWAYDTLVHLEDHAAFDAAFAAWLANEAKTAADEILAHQRHLLAMPRFDLVLNACLLWMADEGTEDRGQGTGDTRG
jgi:hypothetical protein